MKANFYNRGQSLFGIIIVLAAVGLTLGGFYFFKREPPPKEDGLPSSPSIYVSSGTLRQGDTLFISVKSDNLEGGISGELASAEIGFLKLGNGWIGIAGIDAKEKPGKYDLAVNLPDGGLFKKEIEIIDGEFPTTELVVTKELEEKGYTPSGIVESITAKDNIIIKDIFSVYTPEAFFNSPFIYPLEKIKIVGNFGNIRKSGNSGAQHLGTDLDASVGTEVYAVNDGIVRFSGNLAVYGKTLIIDHGLGIYSFYLHLNEFNALKGEKVKRGDIVGYSGNSGYSIAPHLHFSIKINGSSVDPMRFIEIIKRNFPLP